MPDIDNEELLLPTRKVFVGEVTATIVASFLSKTPVSASDVPAFIESVFGTMEKLVSGASVPESPPVQEPAVPIKRSVTPDYLICLEDGKKFQSLKRHLMTKYGMTPDDYRRKWGLPPKYPMTAPRYAEKRSDLAKKMGLGKKG